MAIKLMDNDPEVRKLLESRSKEVVGKAHQLAKEIGEIHQEPSFSVIVSEGTS